jgi:hypothetical protein
LGKPGRASLPEISPGKRAGRGRFNQVTLQPPLPLQLFLLLQPMSPVLQPPWPLQLFMPLQSCLLAAESEVEALLPESLEEQPVVVMTAPATRPAMAAETISVLAVLFIALIFCDIVRVYCSRGADAGSRSLELVVSGRQTLQNYQPR